jgi:hypothetical protein
MSHSYSVSSASYDGTGREGNGSGRGGGSLDNPHVLIIGSVDGYSFPVTATWHTIQAANSAGGSDAVKAVLGPILLNAAVINRYIPAVPHAEVPVYHGAVPAPLAPDANWGRVEVPEAEVGSWTA